MFKRTAAALAATLCFAGVALAKPIVVEDAASFVGTYRVLPGSSAACYSPDDDFFNPATDEVLVSRIRDYQGVRVGDSLFGSKMFEFKLKDTDFADVHFVSSTKIVKDEVVTGYGGKTVRTVAELVVVAAGSLELHQSVLVGEKISQVSCYFEKK